MEKTLQQPHQNEEVNRLCPNREPIDEHGLLSERTCDFSLRAPVLMQRGEYLRLLKDLLLFRFRVSTEKTYSGGGIEAMGLQENSYGNLDISEAAIVRSSSLPSSFRITHKPADESSQVKPGNPADRALKFPG
jgi:hypothetical protein